MADINQIITLGIGTPADLEHFILVGLNATGSVAVVDPRAIVITVASETRTFTVQSEDRTIAVPARADIIVPAEEGHE